MYKVVYDVDDTLNNLNEYVMNKLGLQKASQFNIMKCDEYSEQQKKDILEMYGSSDTFRNLSLVEGAKDICNVEKLGNCDVMISSSNFSQEIADIKTNDLIEYIPGMSREKIRMHIGLGISKGIIDDAFIVIDDCLEHIQKYPSSTIKILLNKTHNQVREEGMTDQDYSVHRVKSLIDANNLVYSILEQLVW